MLKEKLILKVLIFISIFLISSNLFINNEIFNSYSIRNKKKIFCFILTTANHLDDRATVAFDTWVSKCDNHAFITLLPEDKNFLLNKESNGFKYKNKLNVLQPEHFITDSYNNLTTKIYLAITNIYKENNDYEWYLKADTDTFIFMNNLRNFLSDKNSSEPVTFGYDMDLVSTGR